MRAHSPERERARAGGFDWGTHHDGASALRAGSGARGDARGGRAEGGRLHREGKGELGG